uniref:Uncharacterized protein n=1 Tax=Candidatus Kentrum sp. TC TaxID=2126339 RepID=A0A451AAV8_9GAMM|nr:MAG: hypothetical protein BECKTC1821F_GA0114240_10872 [Candidatus Kentron sp. TC]
MLALRAKVEKGVGLGACADFLRDFIFPIPQELAYWHTGYTQANYVSPKKVFWTVYSRDCKNRVLTFKQVMSGFVTPNDGRWVLTLMV